MDCSSEEDKETQPAPGGMAPSSSQHSDYRLLADWQRKWLQRNRRVFIDRMQTMDVIDVLVEKGSMHSRLEVYKEIKAYGRERETERARLLLDFLDTQTNKHFRDFTEALRQTDFPGFSSLVYTEQRLAGELTTTSLVRPTNSSTLKFPAVAKLADLLRKKYRELEATSVDGRKPVSLDKFVVNISLLSTDQLAELCDSPGQKTPLTFALGVGSKKATFREIDLENAFDNDEAGQPVRRQLTTGCAGAGKTTAFTQKAPYEWAKEGSEFWQNFNLFFCGSLNNTLWQDAKSLDEVFRLGEFDLTKEEESEVLSYIRQHPDKVLLVADCLEEAPESESSSMLWKVLGGRELPKLNVIISSRPSTRVLWLSKNRPFHQRLEVIGFTPEKIRHYVNKVFSQDPEKAALLRSELKRRPEVLSLMHTPMLASMICHLFQLGKTLPSTHTEVYRSAVLTTLQKSANRLQKEVPSSLFEDSPSSLQKAVDNLTKLAFTGLVRRTTVFSRSDLRDANCLGAALDLGFLSSSLAAVIHKQDVYSFQHHTMLEFLAAMYAIKQQQRAGDRESVTRLLEELGLDGHLTAFWWFVSGMLHRSKCEDMMEVMSEAVRKASEDENQVRLLLLLLQCHLECSAELPDGGSRAVANLIRSVGLKLTSIRLTSMDISAVCLCLHKYHASVTQLHLNSCNISDNDMMQLLSAMLKCKHIAELHLCSNRLSTQSMAGTGAEERVRKVIEQNSNTLTQIRVSGNEAGDDSMEALVPAIKTCSRLKWLSIGDQTMTSGCSRGLADILRHVHHGHGQGLRVLCLHAPIGDDGVAHLLPALHTFHHQSLEVLALIKTGVSLHMVSQLLLGLRNLTFFYLKCHCEDHVNGESLDHLVSALGSLEKLSRLYLHGMGITWQQTAVIVSCVQSMRNMNNCGILCKKSTFLQSDDLYTVMAKLPVAMRHREKSDREQLVFQASAAREGLVRTDGQSPFFAIEFADVDD